MTSTEITLGVSGDVMVTGCPGEAGLGVPEGLLPSCDAVLVNLETTLTRRGAPADKLIRFRADPSWAGCLAGAGVGAATVANNHAFDYGLDGFRDTLDALHQAGVTAIGGGENVENALDAGVIRRGDVDVALIGFASTLPNGCGAAPDRPGIAPVRVLSRYLVDPVTIDEDPGMAPLVETTAFAEDVDRLLAAVDRAAAAYDVVVVTGHWGVPPALLAPYQGHLADYQRPLAHALIDAGADAVFGHHPHALGEVEMHRGRPIFYSLGNFVFHALAGELRNFGRSEPVYRLAPLHGALARLGGFARVTWSGSKVPERVELVPVALDRDGRPCPADNDLRARAGSALRELGGDGICVTEAGSSLAITARKDSE